MADARELSSVQIDKLRLSPPVRAALRDVQAELTAAYRESFIAMVQAMNDQASALRRIQETLGLLVSTVAPQLEGQIPPAIKIAGVDEKADIATALVVADPIGAGYTMSQSALAQALGLPQTDVSVLVRAFSLASIESCAITVRHGKRRDIVNYHPRAVRRFRELVATPPKHISKAAHAALARARRRLLVEPGVK